MSAWSGQWLGAMKIRFKYEKENIYWIIATLVLALVLFWQVRFSAGVLVWFAVFYVGIKNLEIELKEKWAWLWSALLLTGSSVFTAHHVQYLLLDAELRGKISDNKMLLNIICCLVVFLVVQVMTNNAGVACILSHVGFMILAGVNYFVFLFRGNEFIFSDIRSIQTGLSVAGNYEFVLEERAAQVILLSALYVTLMRKVKVTFEKRGWMSAVCVSLAILGGVYVGVKTETTVTETWEQKGSYRNGYILNFALSVRDYFVAEPEGYSAEEIAKLEAAYSVVQDETSGQEVSAALNENCEAEAEISGDAVLEEGERPIIIAVMSESYADLSVVGDFLTNQEVTPFYDSLTENITKGYAISSVFGAKTPNSEWEFMTGNSMAFLPGGSVVYQQYLNSEPTSIVSNLKKEGYTCVAMHPYYDTGWSRNTIYPRLGFDESYFIEHFDQSKILREYITDLEFYEKIIERYESKPANEDLFIMSISMQNHGGYTEKYLNFEEEIRVLGVNYPDANQYLSLLHESDKALEYLITYFEGVDEPVEIVFFGDHHPSLDAGFYRSLNGKGLSGLTVDELEALYTVPFFIWTNYKSEAETIEISSLNYLSTLALEKAGLQLPAYNRFLADMMEVIPAVNARGYYSLTNGCFLHFEDAVGKEAEWLRKYEILQYNNMFDKKGKSELFFPYLKDN